MSAMDTTQHASTDLQGFYGHPDILKGIYYGPGSTKTAIPKLLASTGGKRALVVTGKSLHTKVSLWRTLQVK